VRFQKKVREDSVSGYARGSTFKGVPAADPLQVQHRAIGDTIFDCRRARFFDTEFCYHLDRFATPKCAK